MKKVDFGYEISNRPTGGWEGIGISPHESMYEGELLDIIEMYDENYLISKITKAHDESQIGDIDVRRVLADLYRDGSGSLFVDFSKDYNCRLLEKVLEKENIKEQFEKGISLSELYEPAHRPDKSFKILTDSSEITVSGIRSEVFDQKKEFLSSCHHSFSDMQQEMEKLRAQLREYQQNMDRGGRRI